MQWRWFRKQKRASYLPSNGSKVDFKFVCFCCFGLLGWGKRPVIVGRTDGQTDRQADRQIGRQIGRQTDRPNGLGLGLVSPADYRWVLLSLYIMII